MLTLTGRANPQSSRKSWSCLEKASEDGKEDIISDVVSVLAMEFGVMKRYSCIARGR